MKGIILAGGSGTRLAPMTAVMSKQLLPIYDKPMLFYPLSTLMMAGISEILIVSTPRDVPLIQQLLGNGAQLGVQLHYVVQTAPRGIAEALILGEEFIAGSPFTLILGDNIFYGHKLIERLNVAAENPEGATVFAYHVSDPERYGVVNFDAQGVPASLVEKPKNPTSNWAVTGIYCYASSAVQVAKSLQPSARGELEITDVNAHYLAKNNLRVEKLGRGVAWLDTGTPESMLEASQFIHTLEARQGLKIGCIEEVALRKKLIPIAQARVLADAYGKSAYGDYLRCVIDELAA